MKREIERGCAGWPGRSLHGLVESGSAARRRDRLRSPKQVSDEAWWSMGESNLSLITNALRNPVAVWLQGKRFNQPLKYDLSNAPVSDVTQKLQLLEFHRFESDK